MIYCLSGLDFTYSLARLIFHADINETLPDKTHFWTESGVLRNSQKGGAKCNLLVAHLFYNMYSMLKLPFLRLMLKMIY